MALPVSVTSSVLDGSGLAARTTLDSELARELEALHAAGLLRSLYAVDRRDGQRVMVAGRWLADFSSNDYLGLATDPRVGSAAAAVLQRDQTGAAASRNLSGNHPLHESLETAIARLKGTEAALLFTSGFAANAGALPALADRSDAIYSDALNHASIVDGCRLSRATVRVFPHADLDALGGLLTADRGKFRRRLIVVEGVFSMDGDLFPLDGLIPLAREHDAAVFLDDAHGTGVMGAGGAGSAEHWGVGPAVDVTMGTLGKALGASGSFVAGSALLREYLLNRARTFVFTTGAPPALAAAALAAISVAQSEPWRRERLRANAARLKAGIEGLGYPVSAALPGHIVPVVLADVERTVRIGGLLLERGHLVGAIRPPSVPPGSARLRLTVTAAHDPDEIDALIDALGEALRITG